MTSVPRHLGIVGGGYIGLELGSVWLRLGARVTVVEMLPRLAATLDGQVARALERLLTKQGFQFHLQTRVLGAAVAADRVTLQLESAGRQTELECDRVLVAVGRRPLTRGLGLEEAGVKCDPRTGQVLVDESYRTSVPTIYAIGDLIAGPMLAHKASAEGIAAVECMAGLPGEVNYDAIPAVIYTTPEVASVGLTEEQTKERGIPCCVGAYPFAGSRACALHGRNGRLCQSDCPQPHGSPSGSPHHRPAGLGPDCRMRAGHGVWRQLRGPCPDHSWSPHLCRSFAGSRQGSAQVLHLCLED